MLFHGIFGIDLIFSISIGNSQSHYHYHRQHKGEKTGQNLGCGGSCSLAPLSRVTHSIRAKVSPEKKKNGRNRSQTPAWISSWTERAKWHNFAPYPSHFSAPCKVCAIISKKPVWGYGNAAIEWQCKLLWLKGRRHVNKNQASWE